MKYSRISENIFDCSVCPTRCDGVSKAVYDFEGDAEFSEYYEDKIISYINSKGKYRAQKAVEPGFPDIEIYTSANELKEYIEVKVQQRTFMKVPSYLPEADLQPSDTLALNLSDLTRYFEMFRADPTKPICIAWVLLNRPCILQSQRYKVYVQKIEALEAIYSRYGSKRLFRRQSGSGDVVDGVHKGVVLNYHFSINELKPWDIRFLDPHVPPEKERPERGTTGAICVKK